MPTRHGSPGFSAWARLLKGLWLLALAAFTAIAHAQPHTLLNQFGQVGLLQTPTARGFGKGGIGGGASEAHPYRTFFLHVQPLDWLQGSFRFVDVRNRDFGVTDSDETFTDKGADFQVRLMAEGDWFPQVAIGVTDIGGTGLFSSEHLVASRRYYNWDFHLGLGWGRLGTRADLDNPIGIFADRFEDRVQGFRGGLENTGRLNARAWFTGDTALFGGVVWTPQGGPLSLILELEGNDYQSERLNNNRDVDSRVNVGLNYRAFGALDLGLSFQRGNTIGVSLASAGNFENARGPEKVFRPLPPGVPAYRAAPAPRGVRKLDAPTVARIRRELHAQSIFLHAVDSNDEQREVTVWMGQSLGDNLATAAGRIGRAVIRYTGSAYRELTVVEMTGGNESARFALPVDLFHQALSGGATAEELIAYVAVDDPVPGAIKRASYRKLAAYPAHDFAFLPQVRSNIGTPDGLAVGQILIRGAGTLQLTRRWSITGALAVNTFDNIGDRLGTRFPSGLPRVRSDIGLYLREGSNFYISQIETNYIFSPLPDVYGRVSAGIFEDMYGGVATEFLYRPTGARWALGVEANRVRQRGFEQRFGFRDYETTTGHLTLYYEAPWENIRLITSVGRYLARDEGITFDLSRRFNSGIRFGVFASFTSASREEFGEGAFDKGFYLAVPFDLFSARGGKGATSFSFRPLTRDGGQKVLAGRSLYDTLQFSHTRTLSQHPEAWLQ